MTRRMLAWRSHRLDTLGEKDGETLDDKAKRQGMERGKEKKNKMEIRGE